MRQVSFPSSTSGKRDVTARINHAGSWQTKSGRVIPTDENGRTNMISSAGGAAAGAGAGVGVGFGVALANRALKLCAKVFRVKSHARRKLERIAPGGRDVEC